MKSKIFSLLIILIILAIIAVGFYYVETNIIGVATPSYSLTNSVYDVLMKDNTFFSLGESLAEQGNLSAAQAAYEKALPTASDQYQTGVINFNLAIIQWNTDPIGSIAPLEAIATNPNYANSTRAYALQYIAQASDHPPIKLSVSQMQQLVTTTFAANPFSTMLDNGNIPLAYRQIYDDANALYPLPIPEAMSAEWYATDLLSPGASSSTVAADFAQINANFTALDNAIQTESSDPSLNIFSAIALEDKAEVLRELSTVGLETKSDVVAAYQTALTAYSTVPNETTQDGFARYPYAIFLSSAYGASQSSQVDGILAPIYEDSAYATSQLGLFLTGLANSSSSLRANAVLVASIDPKFKSYLMSLGWTSADFSS